MPKIGKGNVKMKVIESILTKNPCYTAGRKITVKGLMLHSVGCPQPSASVFVKIWNKSSYNAACVHAFIDANDGVIYQTLPWNHRGWHGGGDSNNTHIGVEMCEPACIKYTSGAKFTCSDTSKAKAMVKRTYEAAVELFAYLCKEYNLDPLADGVIVSHSEGHKRGIASGHADPEHLWNGLGMGYTMDGFRKAVKAAMGGDSSKNETAPAKSVKATDPAKSFLKSLAGTYKVTANSGLNVRHGAGITKKIMVCIPKGTAVKCYGYYTSVLGTKWLYIQFTYKNVTYSGFASSKYLQK